MVSSSLDKSKKKALDKEPEPSDSVNTNTSAVATLHGDRLPPSEKIQLLFPKCKPRSDYQYQTSTATTTTPQDTPISTNLISIASSSSQSIHQQQQQPFKTQKNYFNMNNSKLLKLQSPISPDHKKRAEIGGGIGKSSKSSAGSKHSEASENYVETNPFRIGSNNQYFYAPNDSLFDNNNSAMAAASNNNSMMHHYHYPPMMHRSNYQMTMDDRNYFFEPDEIEHNPYVVDTMSTISSSVLKTTPPATPPALTTTPTENSPMGSSRNIWDLSPIKSNTPTRIKSQSPTSSVPFSRQHKGSYKKLLSSPIPIEEDLETGHFYYNNKKPYYQAPQTDSDSNEPAILTDVHEVEKLKSKPQMFNKSKIRPSESSDFIYAEVKKKDERKIVKSKSGSGIMEYDGSPRRFGMSSNDDTENQLQSASKQSNLIQSRAMPLNYPSPTPARPGFPQRVVSYDQHISRKSPEPYSYSDHKGLATYTATSKLIPTTFINSNAYEEERETIHEDAETNSFQEEPSVTNRNASRQDETFESSAQQQQPQQYKSESASIFQVTSPTEENIPTSTFDYLYEFSETRKVLEEFFKCPESDKIKELEKFSDFNESDDSLDIQYDYRGQIEKEMETMYNKEMSSSPIKQENDIDDDNRDDKEDEEDEESYLKANQNGFAKSDLKDNKPCDYYLDSASRSSLGDENVDNDNELDLANSKHSRRMSKSVNSNYFRRQSKNFHYSPDTTDYDSNYGDFDFESESSLRFLATDHSNMPTFTTSASATVPSATVDLSGGPINNYARYCTSMPVLEDGLSSGHASDNENNNQVSSSIDINTLNKRNNIASSISTIQKQYQDNLVQSQLNSNINSFYNSNNNFSTTQLKHSTDESDFKLRTAQSPPDYHSFYPTMRHGDTNKEHVTGGNNLLSKAFKNRDPELESLYTINTLQLTPPPPAPVPHRQSINNGQVMSPHKQDGDIHSTLKDIQTSLQKSKTNVDNSPTHGLNNNNCNLMSNINDYYDRSPVIPEKVESPAMSLSPVWIPRSRDKVVHSPNIHESGHLIPKHKNDDDEEEVDTDLETDRLLGHQMLDDGFYDEKNWSESKQQHRGLLPKISPKVKQSSSTSKSNSSSLLRHGLNVLLPTSTSSECCINNNNSPSMLTTGASFHQTRSLKTSPALNSSNLMSLIHPSIDASEATNETSPRKVDLLDEPKDEQSPNNNQADTIELCNLDSDLVDSPGGSSSDKSKKDDSLLTGEKKKKNKNKEVLIEGVLFRARYLGSTQLVCEGQPTKSTRMMQAEEAVSRIKAPDGENQPSTEVDLFISTEKIMVLNTDLKEIMMDHALRTISYIADIGDLVVLMARRRFVPQDVEANSDSGTGTGGSGNVSGGSGGPTPPTSGKINRTPKMICHVFESEEAQFIAQSIGQAFQVAYMEFLKANGIEDHSFMKEMDYQEVLNSQEIFGDELEIFAKKELQKEVVVPKAKGEILGVVIVESGWGSMLPTVVIANLASNGAAARCGQLNIGDQIIAINGLSLVGLPLSQCQTYIKNTKNQTVVKFTVVPCAPVVEVKIKRPNTKYQLGFSVQNGVICSLLRGGIAERGGVRVGHRIIEINNQSVVAVPHEKIVNLLATSVGEILMKTMPTSMFRLLTGQENPIYI